IARDEFRHVLGLTADPVIARVFRWPRGMPQYTLGHLDRVAIAETRLAAHPTLALAGNAYRGVGIPDCIRSGETAAESVLAALGVGVGAGVS
ncbi:MAG TPA: FAD-dependent oxidoreductase, partial [Thermomicrobiales bacterium]|nr:FAD-dependent oxidoreductase [Thermomicrobiales bacterium]